MRERRKGPLAKLLDVNPFAPFVAVRRPLAELNAVVRNNRTYDCQIVAFRMPEGYGALSMN